MKANTLDVLNNLIEIHLDRATDYERALRKLKVEQEDPDLTLLFDNLTRESSIYKEALGGYFQF